MADKQPWADVLTDTKPDAEPQDQIDREAQWPGGWWILPGALLGMMCYAGVAIALARWFL